MSGYDESIYQPIPYEHATFPVGAQVYIDPSIRALHSSHYAAGQVGTVCASVYFPFLELFEARSYDTYVPVRLTDGQVMLVEQEYVSLAASEEEAHS